MQRSAVVQELNELLPPRDVLNALARVDPFPSITGPLPASIRRIRRSFATGDPAALPSVVRVLGTACGLGISGSGWVAGPDIVVTDAHVIAGQTDTTADGRPAVAVAFDRRNDIAVLRVRGLSRRPLRQVDASQGTPVAIAGYPANGPLTATPGRLGGTATVLSEDAYGNGPVSRRITSFRGRVRRGNSGGPLLDGDGRVVGTVFASRTGTNAGYAVPPDLVRRALAGARGRVSTASCAS